MAICLEGTKGVVWSLGEAKRKNKPSQSCKAHGNVCVGVGEGEEIAVNTDHGSILHGMINK